MNRTHVTLASVVDLNASAPPVFTGTKDYVSTGALDCDHIDPSKIELVSFEDRPSRANLYPAPGDILFAKMAATVKTILVDSETAGKIYSTGFFALHPKDSLISGKLLYHFLFSDSFHRQKDKLSTGATMKGLTNGGFSQITMLLPERAEQDNLADRLDAIRALILNRGKQLAALDTLAKSLFVEMFKGETTRKRLDQIADVYTGTTPSMKVKEYYDSNDIPFFKPSDLAFDPAAVSKSEAFVSKNAEKVSRMFDPGAVLVTCIGATIGKLGIATIRGTCNQQINFLVPHQGVLPAYLAYAIRERKNYLVDMASSTAVPMINKSQFSKTIIALPPIGAQREFRSRVEAIDKSKFAIRKSLDELNRLYRSLLQQYFG